MSNPGAAEAGQAVTVAPEAGASPESGVARGGFWTRWAPVSLEPAPRSDRAGRRRLVGETALVLGVSLGASAIWAILSIIEKSTRPIPLNQQTTSINNSVTPDRPWLDLAYQFANILLPLVPVGLALFLLAQVRRPPEGPFRVMGLDGTRPWRDLGWGAVLAAGIGLPGLAFYLVTRYMGINTIVAAGNLTDNWWTIPIYVLAAFENGALEEIVMLGYLFTRWRQAGANPWLVVLVSAVIRGTYHLYQGWGGFFGNIAMGALFGWFFLKTRRVWPLVIAHTLIDIVSFVGYSLLVTHVSWLS